MSPGQSPAAVGWRLRAERLLIQPIYATRLALLRIAVGLLMTAWSASLVLDVDPLLTWLRVSPEGDIGWWQFWPTASPESVLAMAGLLVLASVLMTFGMWTRWTTIGTFCLTLVLQRYNPLILNGGEFIVRSVLLFGLAMSPSGAYLSIDAYRRAGCVDWRAPHVPPWTLRFVQAHISLGYILTVVLKLRGHSWLAGTAVWYASGLEDLTRFSPPEWIVAGAIGAVLTWSTLAIELGVGVGVWFRRMRPWALAAGVALHIGIAVVFEIWFFSAVMVASYLAFLPDVADPRGLIPKRWRRAAAEPVTA